MENRSRQNPAWQAASVMAGRILMLLMVLMLLPSCDSEAEQATAEEVTGAYLGRLPTGQLECWTLAADGTFTQEFFDNQARHTAHQPTHTFTSIWRITGRRVWVDEITEYYQKQPPFPLLKEPSTARQTSTILWLPKGNGSKVPVIVHSEDEAVILKKVDAKDPTIRTFGWEK